MKDTKGGQMGKTNALEMPYFEIYYPEDNIACAYWQKGKYFYRQYEGEEKPKRISEKEYMQAYEQHYNL